MIVHQANMMHVGFLDLIVLQPILNFWPAMNLQAEMYRLSRTQTTTKSSVDPSEWFFHVLH